MLIPFIYQVINKSKFNFRYPLIFTILSFGIFCSQLVPPIYAMNNITAGRIISMIYYSYYWLLFLNIGYYLGWIQRKFGTKLNNLMEYINEKRIIYVFVLFFVLVVVSFSSKKYKEFTSYKALDSLRTNEAANYYNEMIERYELFENKDLKEVSLKKLENHPYLLYVWDITENKNDWVNVAASKYFNKNSIWVEK